MKDAEREIIIELRDGGVVHLDYSGIIARHYSAEAARVQELRAATEGLAGAKRGHDSILARQRVLKALGAWKK
jgi:hypothetical protein